MVFSFLQTIDLAPNVGNKKADCIFKYNQLLKKLCALSAYEI